MFPGWPMGGFPAAQQPGAAGAIPDMGAGFSRLLSSLAAFEPPAGSAGEGMAMPSPDQLLTLMESIGGAAAGRMPSEATSAFNAAVRDARSLSESLQTATTQFRPERLVKEALRTVQEMPEGVKAQVRARVNEMLSTIPADLTDDLGGEMKELFKQLPPSLTQTIKESPEKVLEEGADLAANLTETQREALVNTTRHVLETAVGAAIRKPGALIDSVTRLADSMPPEFTDAVMRVHRHMQVRRPKPNTASHPALLMLI